jgi:GNAT superfamily N-acetyltransferase
MDYVLLKITSKSDWKDYHAIRKAILFTDRDYNQNHPDEHLVSNHPMLLKVLGKSVATVRLDFFHNNCTLRLVAVSRDEQAKGYGRKLYELIEKYALENNANTLRVNAKFNAVGYYKKMGFIEQVWDKSELKGIAKDGIQMVKRLG